MWGKLKSHDLAHKTFRDAHDLDGTIHEDVTALNAEFVRMIQRCGARGVVTLFDSKA